MKYKLIINEEELLLIGHLINQRYRFSKKKWKNFHRVCEGLEKKLLPFVMKELKNNEKRLYK